MIRKDLLNRALQRALRQVQTRPVERFRCKEPLAEEITSQFKNCVTYSNQKNSNNLIEFAKELKEWIDEHIIELNENLGSSLLSPQPNIINKPQPDFVSSVFASLLRFELLTTYLRYLKLFNIGCILGGSVSYGKFFNVRQELKESDFSKQSDIDLLIVCDYEQLHEIIKKHTKSYDIDKTPTDYIHHFLYGLVPLFHILNKEKKKLDIKNTIISKQYKIETNFKVGEIFYGKNNTKYAFPLSIHIIPKNIFKSLTNPLAFDAYQNKYKNNKPLFFDIRLDSKFPDTVFCSIMEGISVPEAFSRIIKQNRKVEFGNTTANLSICEIPAYFYWEDRFVSGIYQNLILPLFEVLVDDEDQNLKKGCDNFINFLIKESYRELSVFRDSRLSLSKLHPRHLIFPKFLTDALDKTTERHITLNKDVIVRSYSCPTRIKVRKKFHQKYRKDQSLYKQISSEIKDEQNVLELGCGSGNFLNFLKAGGHDGKRVGIDLVDNWRGIYTDDIAEFVKGDIEELSKILTKKGYKKKTFDIVLAIHVLYHVKNIPLLIEEVTSWLKDDGYFLATTNSNKNLFLINDVVSDSLFKLNIGALFDKKYNNFSAENAMENFREYFAFMRQTVIESDFIIEDINDVISYVVSNFDNYEIPEDPYIRQNLTKKIKKLLETKARHGKIKDRKIVALISGRNPIRINSN